MTAQLSVVIPTHNAADRIAVTVEDLLTRCSLTTEVIIVNDASTDDTATILATLASRYPNVTALHHDRNLGAGTARNTGFARATGDYTLFLDDDDIIMDGAIDLIHAQAVETGADLVIAPYLTATDRQAEPRGMHEEDRKFWENALQGQTGATFSTPERPDVLRTTNYPWNKLCPTAYLREIGLTFSSTPVHNDIFAHWQIITNSRTYHVSDQPICTHVVSPAGNNITNIWDHRRLALFHVLNEIEDYFDRHPLLRARYYSQFLAFFTIVVGWANDRTPETYRADFARTIKQHLSGLSVQDYINLCRSDKVASERLMRMKFDTYRFARVERA